MDKKVIWGCYQCQLHWFRIAEYFLWLDFMQMIEGRHSFTHLYIHSFNYFYWYHELNSHIVLRIVQGTGMQWYISSGPLNIRWKEELEGQEIYWEKSTRERWMRKDTEGRGSFQCVMQVWYLWKKKEKGGKLKKKKSQNTVQFRFKKKKSQEDW